MRVRCIIGLLVLGMFLITPPPEAPAGELLGKLCFQLDVDGKSFTVPVIFTQMAPGFYLLHGAPSATVDSRPLFQGAAQVRGATLRISISWTVTDGPQRETAEGEFDFDLQTLNGDGWFLWKTHWIDSGKTYEGYKEAALSLHLCP